MAHLWRIVMYVDGISPQTPVNKNKDRRAVGTLYWSFLEFDHRLWDEQLWMCVNACRKIEIARLGAGMSHNVSETLRQCFFDAESFNFETQSLTLDMRDAGGRE